MYGHSIVATGFVAALSLLGRPASAGTLLEEMEREVVELVETCAPQIVTVQAQFPGHVTPWGASGILNVGSGLVLDTSGYIVTSSAVLSQGSAVAEAISVVDTDRRLHEAMLFGVDSTLRVAFLYVPTITAVRAAEYRSTTWNSGSFAVIVGNSSGVSPAVSMTTVAGPRGGAGFWQLSGPATPGMSGAPVFDSSGRLGGLLVGEVGGGAGLVDGRQLPALMVSSTLLRRSFERVRRPVAPNGGPWLGITVRPQVEPDGTLRIYVSDVVSDSPAQAAGVQAGDLLVGIDDVPIGYVSDLADWVHRSSPGREATLQMLRSGETRAVTVRVGRR